MQNIDETVRSYRDVFGMGPFEVRFIDYPTAGCHGEKGGYRGKRAIFYLGPIQIELIEGKTIHEDFLKEKGEGIHHLGFEVKDLEKAMEKARRKGLQITQHFIRKDGSGFAYLDSEKPGGVICELIVYPPEMKKLEIIEKT